MKKSPCQISENDTQQVCVCFGHQLIYCHELYGGFLDQIKDKRSKLKKLKLFTTIALNAKVRPQIALEGFNS